MEGKRWISCQLGAREHYSVPRALHSAGMLERLVTEAWVPPGSGWGHMRRNLRERYHEDVPRRLVKDLTGRAVGFELVARMRGWTAWEAIMRRNEWFQRRVVSWLDSTCNQREQGGCLFSFSYTAHQPFAWASSNGWRKVLGQIDGALGEEKKIIGVHERHGGNVSPYRAAPDAYWDPWREECEAADQIVVNSEWSRGLLVGEGIAEDKVTIVPLAYSPPRESLGFTRKYPAEFCAKRPLQVLFLGQVTVRKGAFELLEAAAELESLPVEFLMVGPEIIEVPKALRQLPNVRWVGAVPRGVAQDYYEQADVFLFPTHSDGFGLTQLEAQAWKLPIIASRFCGRVVQPNVNGWELPEVNAVNIVQAVDHCLASPEILKWWSENSIDFSEYSMQRLASRLQALS